MAIDRLLKAPMGHTTAPVTSIAALGIRGRVVALQ